MGCVAHMPWNPLQPPHDTKENEEDGGYFVEMRSTWQLTYRRPFLVKASHSFKRRFILPASSLLPERPAVLALDGRIEKHPDKLGLEQLSGHLDCLDNFRKGIIVRNGSETILLRTIYLVVRWIIVQFRIVFCFNLWNAR